MGSHFLDYVFYEELNKFYRLICTLMAETLLFAISSRQCLVDLNKVTFDIRLEIRHQEVHWTLFKTPLFKTQIIHK